MQIPLSIIVAVVLGLPSFTAAIVVISVSVGKFIGEMKSSYVQREKFDEKIVQIFNDLEDIKVALSAKGVKIEGH